MLKTGFSAKKSMKNLCHVKNSPYLCSRKFKVSVVMENKSFREFKELHLSSWCESVIRSMKGRSRKSVLVKDLYVDYVVGCHKAGIVPPLTSRDMAAEFVNLGCGKKRFGKGIVIKFG